MDLHTSAPPTQWTELATQWQDLGGRWARWWEQLAVATQPAGMVGPAMGASGLTLPTFPAAHIEPIAAAALTEQYNRKFEALWLHALQGTPATAPHEHRDRRFASKEWREQPYFLLLKDAYLLYAEYLHQLVALAQGEALERKRLAFLVDQYIDAIAPSNFLATNPDALKLALDSGGASLAQGLSNLAADAQRGRISMTDETAFAVGVNLAITPGSVVYRNELIELIQYAPTTKTVFKRPLLIVPPCINKYYILDLQPENSFVRYAVEQGHTVFMVSWRNVRPEQAPGALRWDDYLENGRVDGDRPASAKDITASKRSRQRPGLLRRRHAARVRRWRYRPRRHASTRRQRHLPHHHARFLRSRARSASTSSHATALAGARAGHCAPADGSRGANWRTPSRACAPTIWSGTTWSATISRARRPRPSTCCTGTATPPTCPARCTRRTCATCI